MQAHAFFFTQKTQPRESLEVPQTCAEIRSFGAARRRVGQNLAQEMRLLGLRGKVDMKHLSGRFYCGEPPAEFLPDVNAAASLTWGQARSST